MSNYICKYGLYHDKPCKKVNGEYQPSSNNGWIYTAIAKLLELPINWDTVLTTKLSCCYHLEDCVINRLPNKKEPPISRDELIGLQSIGYCHPISGVYLKGWTWLSNPSLSKYKANIFKVIREFWKAKKEHRNYLWVRKIYCTYPYLFRVKWSDRYYFLKANPVLNICENPAVRYRLAWFIHKHWTLRYGTPGDKNILALQCIDLGDRFVKNLDVVKNIVDYFGEDHVFSKTIRERRDSILSSL